MPSASAPDAEQLIAALESPALRELAARGRIQPYRKDVVMLQEGDHGDTLYVVLAGRVKVFATGADDREIVFDIHGPGEYVGEMALDGGPRSASVMTLEPSRFSVITTEQFKQFFAQHPDIGLELIKSLIHRVRALTKTVGNLGLLDVYGRVARLLLDLAVEENGSQVIKEHLTQQDMASRVGCSREMISRILKDLRVGGYIRMDGDHMIIAKKPPSAW